ncbi:MAG: T9SS type A sorting domain-containing protein [Bacteroidales bacterium]|nr:T9SS type A sorting domain-containing protein [Bacteroidales bacterium]
MNFFINYLPRNKRAFVTLLLTVFAFGFTAKAQYGDQFYNYGFEEWVNEGSSTVEPAHWHSFMSASGSFSFLMSQQINYSNETRPGSEGSRSARIYSKSIVGITANGNMTTGRINAGSMSAAGSENYNYTQRNSDYCTPISSLPDSLAVWVCFRAGSSNSQASIMATIHGDADFQQLGDGGFYPANMLCATANKEYSRTCASGESLVWKRIAIPFTAYPDVCTDYRYILTTFTTNKTPGGGSENDEVYVDDIVLIYNPSLNLGDIAQTEFVFSPDETSVNVDIPFTLTGSMSTYNLNVADNEVIAQLSDANGNFDNPIELGRVTTNESGVIHGVIPYTVEDGDGYRIRVVSTNYPMTSQDNGMDISIYGGTGVDAYYATCVNIYPNPADDFIKVTSNNIIREINIFSIDGRMMYSNNMNDNEKMIDLSSFNKGTYIIRMITDEDVVVRKIMIN